MATQMGLFENPAAVLTGLKFRQLIGGHTYKFEVFDCNDEFLPQVPKLRHELANQADRLAAKKTITLCFEGIALQGQFKKDKYTFRFINSLQVTAPSVIMDRFTKQDRLSSFKKFIKERAIVECITKVQQQVLRAVRKGAAAASVRSEPFWIELCKNVEILVNHGITLEFFEAIKKAVVAGANVTIPDDVVENIGSIVFVHIMVQFIAKQTGVTEDDVRTELNI